jgi:hypothetical protein
MAKRKLTDEEQAAKTERVRKERLEKAIRQFEEFGTESKNAQVVVKEAINKAQVALIGDVRIRSSEFDVADFTVEVRQAFAINATVYIRLRMGSFSDAVRADDGRTFTPLNLIVEVNTPGTGRDVEASMAFAQLLTDLNTFALRVKAMLSDRTFYALYTPETK